MNYKKYITKIKHIKFLMNSKGFNQFKSFINQKGPSSGGKNILPLVLGFGLLWLAQSSIYYGNY